MIQKNDKALDDNFVIDKINRRRKKIDRLRQSLEIIKKDILRLKRESWQYAKANGKTNLFFEAFPEEKERMQSLLKEKEAQRGK